MTQHYIKHFISYPRFNVYLAKTNQNFERAFSLYKANIELSEALYPILSLLEISLRNSVNETLTSYFEDPFWFENQLPAEFSPFISKTIHRLKKQGKRITCDSVIAELNFGFWDRLFNRNYAKLLWKPLRVIFQNAPKHLRQRDTIADILYRIRTLRNRVYHYEPVLNNTRDIAIIHAEMLIFLSWLDNDLPFMIEGINRFDEILKKVEMI